MRIAWYEAPPLDSDREADRDLHSDRDHGPECDFYQYRISRGVVHTRLVDHDCIPGSDRAIDLDLYTRRDWGV